jgi:hypothetical protein
VKVNNRVWRRLFVTGGLSGLLVMGCALLLASSESSAAPPWLHWGHHQACDGSCGPCGDYEGPPDEWAGTWYWQRSPDEEKRVIMSEYNRYCVRCHGIDGRGVWDIPDVPNFTNARWQASRSDGQLARIILEGRGAVMPPFRGTLSLEEAWAMARYLRTFDPGAEHSRPEDGTTTKPAGGSPIPARKMPGAFPE